MRLSRRTSAPVLRALALTTPTVEEGAEIGTVIGRLIHTKANAAYELTDDAGGRIELDGRNVLVAGAIDYEAGTSFTFDVEETFAGAFGSPKETSGIVIAVTNVLEVILGPLTLDTSTISETAAPGATVGTIQGGTPGSTITLSAQSNATWFAKDGGDIEVGAGTLDENVAAAPTITLHETKADAAPRDSVIAITVTADVTPAAFAFTDQTGVALATVTASGQVTVSALGPTQNVAVTVSGGEYSKNGGAYTAAAGTAANGDTFRVRHTSSAAEQTAINTVLTIGGVSDTFTSTTADLTAPTITSANTASVAENATLAHALTASESVTWTLTGGADQARFEISGSTLRWASNGTKNFEAPNDADTDNAYVVQVTATDAASNATNQTVTVTVTNVLEVTLAALSLSSLSIAEDQPTGTVVGAITGASSGSTVTLLTQSNATMFAKNGNNIEVGAAGLDFETVPSPTITLRETHADASNSPRDTVITITVTDVSEGPVYGNNVVDLGDFSAATGWSTTGSADPPVIAGGVVTGGGADDGNVHRNANETITAGDYEASFKFVSGTFGDIRLGAGSSSNGVNHDVTTLAAGTTYTETITTAATNQRVQINLNSTDAVVDDFVVRRIISP